MNDSDQENPNAAEEESREDVPVQQEAAPEEQAPLLERYQRVCADYENYQRRVARQMQQGRINAQSDIVRAMLPILDDLDRTIVHAEQEAGEPHPMLEGVRLIREKFLKIIAQYDVTEIAALGESFDPAIHEALMAEPREDVPPRTVIELFETGYRIGARTLRPAKVKVSAEPPAPPAPPVETADIDE